MSSCRKEKIPALDLSVDRVVNLLRTENQNIPLGEIYQGDMTYLLRSQGAVPEPGSDPRSGPDDQRRRARVHARRRGGQGRDRRFPSLLRDQRQGRRPDARAETIGHEHRAGRRGDATEIERINREVPGVRLTVLDDSSSSSSDPSTPCRSTR